VFVLRKEPAIAGETGLRVDAMCALAGWTRRDLAEQLGVGETVFYYYEHGTAPRWLVLALIGLAVSQLGLTLAAARELIGESPGQSPRAASGVG